ncbi:hypothetical protein BHE74_00003370 [Ensete ventricosum]|nr:hypothetical protein BHE74_00003370 [Ensete ventricosum]
MFRTFFTLAGAGSHIHMPGMVNSAYSLNDFPSAQSQTNFGYEAEHKKLVSFTFRLASQSLYYGTPKFLIDFPMPCITFRGLLCVLLFYVLHDWIINHLASFPE